MRPCRRDISTILLKWFCFGQQFTKRLKRQEVPAYTMMFSRKKYLMLLAWIFLYMAWTQQFDLLKRMKQNVLCVRRLDIEYTSLDDVCSAEDLWQNAHSALVGASLETRQQICKVLLDFMRRELAIKVDYLNPIYQESLEQLSSQRLSPPWAIDESEKLDHAAVLFPRSRQSQGNDDYGGNVYLSARGGYGQFLRRKNTIPNFEGTLKTDDASVMIQQILDALRAGGLVEIVQESSGEGEVNGYQVPASAMAWKVGDGTNPFHDLIRVPRLPVEGGRTNQYFVGFYRNVAKDMHGLEAHEHTAQVPSDVREQREHA